MLAQRPEQTGSGIYLQAVIRELAARGLAQSLVAGVPGGMELPEMEGLSPEEFAPVPFGTPALPFPVVGMSDVMPYPSTRWSELRPDRLDSYLAAFGEVLVRRVETFCPDVIHTHHLWLLTALVRVLFPGRRVVASCHSTDLRQLQMLPRFEPLVAPGLRRLDAVLALTREQKDSIRDRLGLVGERIHVVGAGYRSDLFGPGRDPRVARRVIYAGKLSRSKGLPWLLEAGAPLLRHGRMELELAGAGAGEEALQIEAAARSIGARLLGSLPQAGLARRFQRAAVFVLPSFYEGLPLVLIEALACGCRVVTTGLPGISSWLSEDLVSSGWVRLVEPPPLVSPDEPASGGLPAFVERLRVALERALASPDLDPVPVERALAENSWSGVVERILAHY